MELRQSLLSLLGAGVFALAPGIAHATSDDPIATLSFTDTTFSLGQAKREWLTVTVSEPLASADVQVRLDKSRVAGVADVSSYSDGCTNETVAVVCHLTMDLPQGPSNVAFIEVTARVADRTGKIITTGSVNGVAMPAHTAKVTVRPQADLAAIGTTVSAVGKNQVKIRVGVKNVGRGPALFESPSWTYHPVIAYIHLPRNTFGESATYQCAGWGPYPDGWGWEDPGRGSYKYACISGTLEPGVTLWFDLVVNVFHDKPVDAGDITVIADNFNTANDIAPIVVNTKGSSLPVTGQHTMPMAAAGSALVVVGILLFVTAHRRRPRRG